MTDWISVLDKERFPASFHDRHKACPEKGAMMTTRATALELLKVANGPMSMAELKAHGITKTTMRSLIRAGDVENPAWGVYRLASFESNVHSEWALVAKKYPDAVVSLLSAAAFHNMTQEIPAKLTVGVPKSLGGSPSMGVNQWFLELDTLMWRNPDMLTLGVEEHVIDGVKVKITSPERTLVDMFRYSSFNRSMRVDQVRITDEMFLESLNRASSDKVEHFSFDTVAALARTFKCYDAMRPYTKTVRYVRNEVPSY